MAEEFIVAEAVVQMSVKGDTAPEVAKQQADADRANRRHAATVRQQQREQLAADRAAKAQDHFGGGGKGFDRAFGGDAFSKFQQTRQRHMDRMAGSEGRVNRDAIREQSKAEKQREQREKEAAKDNEKTMTRMQQIRRRMQGQVEGFHKNVERVDRETYQETKRAADARRMGLLKAGALTKVAFGSVPFVGAGADIAMAGAAGGPIGAAAMATGKGLQYGIEGAGKASPATAERLQYQQDRLQAIIGREFVPAVERAAKVFEKVGDFTGGKGSQLATPQFSNFAEMRDRLQMEALRGLPEDKAPKGPGASTANLIRKGISPFADALDLPDFGASRIVGEVGDKIDERLGGHLTKAWENSALERGYRSVMKVF